MKLSRHRGEAYVWESSTWGSTVTGICGTCYLGVGGWRKPVLDLWKGADVSLAPPSRPHRLTLAVSETVFQFPPLRVNLPLPILVRISSGVSLGPLANGVYLERSSKIQL